MNGNPIITNQFIQMIGVLKEKSDLRIGQIIGNALVKMEDLYYMEDQDLLNLMTEVYKDFGSIYIFNGDLQGQTKSESLNPEQQEISQPENLNTQTI